MANKNRQKHLANRRTWWAKNKGKENAKRQARIGADRDGHNAKKRQVYASLSPEQKQRLGLYMYTYGLKRRFEISITKWLAIFKLQGERCACCRRPDPGRRRWHTDHDHQTGAIRGILCHKCNAVLGMLGDSLPAVEESTARFTAYLKGAEPVWKDGIVGGTLLVWEPKERA